MKQRLFTLLLIAAIGLTACRRDKVEPDIKQYDDIQIQNYIKSQGITGMIKDPTGGDTTGLYYKIILPGSGAPVDYTTNISFVYTLKTLDGRYVSTDTINNHFEDYLGHLATPDKLPLGLELGILNNLKYQGGSMRILIPSHLAYGINGNGTGSSQTTNSRIPGNESLDYYVHLINNYPAYDDLVIKNYIKDSLSSANYTAVKYKPLPGEDTSKLSSRNIIYYSIITKGTGTNPTTINSTITCNYTGKLLNGVIFDGANNGPDAIATLNIADLVPGVIQGLTGLTSGTKISLLIPSQLGYGNVAQTGIPVNSCLRFTFIILSVTP